MAEQNSRLDPHFWLSPRKAETEVLAVRDAFIKADPANAAAYEKNAAEYIERLKELDRKMAAVTQNAQIKTFVTTHAAFGHLAADYGLKQISIMGLSPQSEPSPAALNKLVGVMHAENIKYVFFETLVSPRIAESIAAEAGAEMLTLHARTRAQGYSGTAIYSKTRPISVSEGIGIEEHDNEGRTLIAEYENFYLVCVYVPNSQDELKRLDYRQQWNKAFEDFVSSLKEKKSVVFCGDLNVAHTEIDLKNPKTNLRNPGFTIEERNDFSRLLSRGFIDTFRYLHPDEIKYSWWSYRFRAREKGIGWRIDYFIISEDLKDKLRSAEIHNDVFGSDHCPVSIDIDL